MSSSKLSDISNNVVGSVGGTDDDEAADEVKVFRTNDADEATYNIEDPQDELTADKTDVAFEADIETEPLGQRSAFSATSQRQQQTQTLPNLNLAFPSPNCELLLPMLMAPLASPLSFAAYNNPLMRMSPMAQAANFLIRNSPSYQQQFAAAAAVQAAQFRAAAPNFGLASSFGMGNLLQPAQTSFHNLGIPSSTSTTRQNLMSNASTSARINSGVNGLGSPLSSMSNGLNGMNLLEKTQNSHKSIFKTQTTPKRPSALASTPGASASTSSGNAIKTPKREKLSREEKKNHVKKPCNAFMWYMRENRARLLKEEGGQQVQSAVINKKLGIEWQSLSKKDQQKYFDLAAKEREEHQNLHPDWTARDNYAIKKKNKKKLREKSNENNDQKKCRARYGVDNQQMWCKHCKRKKRCLNVREVESPSVTSTTNPQTINEQVKIQQQQHQQQQQQSLMMLSTQNISSSSSTASSSISRHVDSPSSSGIMSVGKRTESNESSNFDSNTPPPFNASQLANATLANALAGSLGNFVTPKIEQTDGFGPTGTPIVTMNSGVKSHIDEIDIAKPTPSHMHQLMSQHPQHFFNQQHQLAAAAAAAAAATGMQQPPYHNFMAAAAAAGLAAASAGFGSPHNFFRP